MFRNFKRRRKNKTNYNQRVELLKGRKTRLVVRRSLNNIHIQFVNYEKTGDKIVIEAISKKLASYGWKGHCGNVPAAYLTGLLAGLDAVKNGVKEAVLDMGLHGSTKGSAIYAAAAGVKSAGINISLSDSIVPSENQIKGKHIAEYAKLLKKDTEKYKKQFSKYLKNDIEPENLPVQFEEVKKKILEEKGAKNG